MKYYTIDRTIDFKEDIVEEEEYKAHHIHLTANQEVPEHFTNDDEIVILLSGKVNFKASDEVVMMTPGSFVILEPREIHALMAIEESHVLVILHK